MTAFPSMIEAFSKGGTDPIAGDTGPFWVGSGELFTCSPSVCVHATNLMINRSGDPECARHSRLY